MLIGSLGVYICLFFALYFEVFLLISFLEKRPSAKTAAAPKRYPTVSIVVPCYNEEKTIASTLESLLALTYPKDKLDIIVVDDGSRDTTAAIARRYVGPQVTLIQKENGGKYTALNLGIAHSKAELVGCLDADSFAAPDALLEVVKRFEQDESVAGIMPAMRVYQPRNLLERMQAVEYAFGVFFKKMFDNLSAISVLPGPFSFYRRDVFDTIGPFRHAHNTEDMEIAFRMHLHGLKIVNAHTALVHTTVPTTVRALLKQRVRWSQGFLENSRDYRRMYFNPRYGNFGMLVLPFGLFAFFAGLYTAGYALWSIASSVASRALDMWATRIPPHLEFPQFELFYLNTSMMTFTIIAVLGLTVLTIMIGKRLAETRISPLSLVSYFALFGFIAPVWLAHAVWNAARSQPSTWR